MEILRDSKDAIRSIYLDTIYDNGTVNLIYKNFPDKFIVWLKGFDEIQTTNYDSNLELATSREVMHVHGAFSDMKDIYRSDSLRNMLSDRPIDNVKIFYEYAHLYSTALTAYSGDTKDFMAKQAQNSNEALVKLVDAYNNNPEVKADVDSWKNSSMSGRNIEFRDVGEFWKSFEV